jgi:hypothetical protein
VCAACDVQAKQLEATGLSEDAVHKCLKTVLVQLEATKFLPEDEHVSLFGENKSEIAEMLLVKGLHDLGFRIINDFRLAALRIYEGVVSRLLNSARSSKVLKQQLERVMELLKGVQGLLSEDETDELICCTISHLVALKDTASATKLVGRITSVPARVKGCIACGRLPQALEFAKQSERKENLELVLEASESVGNKDVAKKARKLLQQLVLSRADNSGGQPPGSSSSRWGLSP